MEEGSDEEKFEEDNGVDNVFAPVNILNILEDTEKFRTWLKEKHGFENYEQFLEGYKFFVETTIRVFLHGIIYSSSVEIEEDFTFYRAEFEGVKIKKVPVTCDKTRFVRNVNKLRRSLLKAENWDEVESCLEEIREEISNPFNEILENQVEVSGELSIKKETALKYATLFNAYIFFVDVSKGYPKGYFVSLLEDFLKEGRLENALLGYKYTLQFLFHSLLEKEKFSSSGVKNLHRSDSWVSRKQNKEEIDDIDSYFSIIKEEIITPIEKKLGLDLGFEKLLHLENEIPKEEIKNLLKPVESPELNTEEQLDHKLLWYEAELLDKSKTYIFNGVPAFMSLLSGTVEMKNRFSDGNKAFVCKFKHPAESGDGNDYTYGVLIESSGTVSDYSGWMMFFDCCTDYSGFGGSEHMMAEKLIDDYQERDLIEVREMKIDREKFKKYLSKRVIGEKGMRVEQELEESEKESTLEDKLQKARGVIIELLSHYILSNKKIENINWNIKTDDGQLDILLNTSREAKIIECKYDPSNYDFEEQIKKLKNKINQLNSDKRKSGEFWFWHRPEPETRKKIKRERIEYKIIPEMVRNSSIFAQKPLSTLKFILKKSD